jgi:membrane protein implicated in regulation of membrane protease activity
MSNADGRGQRVGRVIAVVVSVFCGIVSAAFSVTAIALMATAASRVSEPVLALSAALSLLLPVSLVFGVVAVRGLDASAVRLLGVQGWRLIMAGVVAIGVVSAITLHPVALVFPLAIAALIYFTIDPTAGWLFGGFVESSARLLHRLLTGRQRPEIGGERLVGQSLSARSDSELIEDANGDPWYQGTVTFESETWTIRAARPFRAGEHVRVIRVGGAILMVEPI